ncbi:ATP-binding protein [Halobacteriovorax sp. GB3]|uniref:hybrid sensor histidine kinase/response regulator n=1 Tax=Halobacteriovorax sp. GB3 TaxID=2719615 RepID=UPI002360AE49|nr:ATP-binding protein [Halobacteriovorax sp. GB3]MDD0851784.1 ATP-binding protein [Halobacteriovorax sp. GB3]
MNTNDDLISKSRFPIGLNLLILIFAFAGGYLINHLYIRGEKNDLKLSNAQLARGIKQNFFYDERHNILKIVGVNDPILKASLQGYDVEKDVSTLLNSIQNESGASIVYLINREGVVIQSTDYTEGKSLLGRNYSFRPYFKKAIKGIPYVYTALGVTTKKRGVYYSAPVYQMPEKKGEIIGVIVLKMNLDNLDGIMNAHEEFITLVNPQGDVFATNRKEWLYKNIDAFSERDRIYDLKRYGDVEPSSIENFVIIDEMYVAIDGKKYLYNVQEFEVFSETWKVLSYSDYRSDFPVYILVIFTIIMLIVFFLSNTIFFMFKKLEVAKREAVDASLAKGQFLANMSHEIRTPISGILGLCEMLLEDHKIVPKTKEKLTSIHQVANHLLYIVNDILDFSKVEAGKLDLMEEDYDLAKLLETILYPISLKAHDKNLSFSYHIDSKLPLYIKGDSKRLGQVLTNLAGNAVKFTEKGRVEIDLRPYGQSLLEIKVSDTGIGIKEDDQKKLFESFVQADLSTSRKFGGTGLGLAISKKIVELMGGRIELESDFNKGTVFRVLIPIKEGQRVEHVETSKTLLFEPHQFKVLLAEDNRINQIVTRGKLHKLGFKVITIAEDGVQVLREFEKGIYDIVFMDCQMPNMNGFEATERIRELEEDIKTHIPIIALTANAMRGDREKCLEAGMDEYLSKPINEDDLIACLNYLHIEKKI